MYVTISQPNLSKIFVEFNLSSFSHAPACSRLQEFMENLCNKSWQKIGNELDHLQVSTIKNSGKKPNPENPGKNPDI